MKLNARQNSGEAANDVARQFEGLFVQQMLSAMRAAAKIDNGQHSSYMDFYQEMYDKQMAQTIAGQDRLGVAKLIMRQLPAGETSQAPEVNMKIEMQRPHAAAAVEARPAAPVDESPHAVLGAPVTAPGETAPPANVKLGKVVDDDFAEVARIESANNRWRQPRDFIADVWPEAQSAAANLGVSPQLLLAQSALETGWGRHTMKFDDGRNGYNLFGIKAGSDWQGATLNRVSLEYRDGVLRNEHSRFRAYDSPAASLSDYVDFIRSNPRYQQALDKAGDDHAYIRAIQDAGYATDPEYANKVIGILDGAMLRQTLAAIDPGVSNYG